MIRGGYFVQASGMSIPCEQSLVPYFPGRSKETLLAGQYICNRIGISQVEVSQERVRKTVCLVLRVPKGMKDEFNAVKTVNFK